MVRLVQGRSDKKIYSRDPVKTARHWVRQGAQLLHIVDLDGAFSGVPKNLAAVKEIARNVDIPIEFGGGVRTEKTLKDLLDSGVSRVVLGTKAAQDRTFLKKAFGKFKERIIISVDVKAGEVFIKGWRSNSGAKGALSFVRSLKELGFQEIIYTDIAKDGTLHGPNIKDTKDLLKQTAIKIIASGGISSLEDIRRLKLLEKKGLIGIIIGKALYEGRFTLQEALRLT